MLNIIDREQEILIQYCSIKKFGDIVIDRHYEFNNVKLGQYIDRFGRQYKEGKLKQEVKELLNNIEDWNWQVR